ncbi:esterase [Betaproteobacteria bacterium]|nr:esterase [Betaproteobacteria bacterium]GHU44789.1 esterase [Betaproteobacteria bacterium]
MPTPSILYLHGFASSPQSWKVTALREAMTARGIAADRLLAPQLPWPPQDAIALLKTLITTLKTIDPAPLTLAGSSLGGYYASWLAEKYDLKAVLINPAVAAHLTLERYLGIQKNFHTGDKIHVEPANLETLRAFAVAKPTQKRYLLLLETGDEVLDYQMAKNLYAGATTRVCPGGNHSFTRFPEFIPQILEFAGL